MADSAATLRRLRWTLSCAWAALWIAGLSTLGVLAIRLNAALEETDLDAELESFATATYGLTWFDAAGQFHGESWQQDSELRSAAVDIWVVEPGASAVVHLAPESPGFTVPDLNELALAVVADPQPRASDGIDGGRIYRLHAQPIYQEGENDRAVAAVVVVGDPADWQADHQAFVRSLLGGLLLLGVFGIGVGVALAQWSLRPVARSFVERERFLAAVAHELRTPLASLRGVCESALAGDEPPADALGRLTQLADRSSKVVDDLLLYARLDAGTQSLDRQAVRLDLLVEALLPEDGSVKFDAAPQVVEIDPKLVTAALRNLLDNALRHGGGEVAVSCDAGAVVVEDCGPGLPKEVLQTGDEAWAMMPSRYGNGLGLSIVRWVARLHGGTLQLANRPQDGVRARLSLLGAKD